MKKYKKILEGIKKERLESGKSLTLKGCNFKK